MRRYGDAENAEQSDHVAEAEKDTDRHRDTSPDPQDTNTGPRKATPLSREWATQMLASWAREA